MSTIAILGTGCPKCKQLYNNALEAVQNSKEEHQVVKVESLKEIVSYGVMTTPALVIDGQVRSAGRLLKPIEILNLLP